MKKLILLALVAVMMAGCEERNTDGSFHAPKSNSSSAAAFQTIIIDSCEYIEAGYRLAHRGNCRYCAERRKQELRDIIGELKNK